MARNVPLDPFAYVDAIRRSKLTIYDPIEIGHPTLWIPGPELEILLNSGLRGKQLVSVPIKTRSKVAKSLICEVLGYPTPLVFRKTRPRFPGQMFDVYTQKSNNLQVWNEEVSAARRYVLLRPSADQTITRVKVVTGDTLASLDKTGKLTQKYQAKCVPGLLATELITSTDTKAIVPFVVAAFDLKNDMFPVAPPHPGQLLSINTVFLKLSKLVGMTIPSVGIDQERNRGAELHRLVCKALGYQAYQDNGQFPDVRHQLLEVKLQTTATIDLGLFRPDSESLLDVPMLAEHQIRHCDVRYAVFYGKSIASGITLTHLFLTTGEAFFTRFPQFQGMVLNKKLQIPLPANFFG